MTKACAVMGCGRKVIARGLCWPHYQRDRRGSAVNVRIEDSADGKRARAVKYGPVEPPWPVLRENRFRLMLTEELVTPEPNTGCLLWCGSEKSTGYGGIGNMMDPWGGLAHRAVLYLLCGVELERNNLRRHVRHLCDNRACVNPAHLVYGTAAENVADRERRYIRDGRKPEAA